MDKAMELLEQLANNLGVAVEYLWATLVKQQYVEGVTNIILAVFGIIAFVLIVIYSSKIIEKINNKYKELVIDRRNNGTGYNGSYTLSSFEEDRYKNLSQSVPVIIVISACIIFILTAIFIIFGVQQLLNPDYFALKEILSSIQ